MPLLKAGSGRQYILNIITVADSADAAYICRHGCECYPADADPKFQNPHISDIGLQ